MRTIAFDTETFYVKPKPTNPGYSVSNLGNWRYMHDDRFDCYMLSVFDGEDSWVGEPKDFNWDALEGATLLSHNAGFDSVVYERMVEIGQAPRIKPADWLCTANMTSFLSNRRSLAEASQHLLKVRVSKSARDWMNGKHWSDAIKEGKATELTEYARGDVIHCWNLFKQFSHLWTPLERGLSDLTIRQCRRGVAIDTEKLLRYKATVQLTLFHLEKSLPWVAEGAKVTSSKAIAEQCRRVGIPCAPVKSHDGGEEAFIEWENTYGPKFSWVANVSLYRSMNKILSTIETIEERLRPDGTIDFSLLYFGAHTGRWTGAGSGLNMQNLRKESIYILDDYTVLLDASALKFHMEQRGMDVDALLKATTWDLNGAAIAHKDRTIQSLFETFFARELREKIDMRSLFVPRPGHQFIISDLAQIEPRVLNWLCGNHELLARLKGGMSIYEAHARDTMGWTGGDLKKQNPMIYKTAKARVLGLGYGCGHVKFRVVAKTLADLDVSEGDSVTMVDGFRSDNPKIVNLWGKLDARYRGSRGKDFELELPSGRTLRYGAVKEEKRAYKDDEGKLQWKSVYTADVGGRRRGHYGGLLVENATQATSRDVFGEHLLALDRAGIPVVFHAHDEAITELPTGTDKREVESIMSQTPDWLEGCPIGAEAVVADHYLK